MDYNKWAVFDQCLAAKQAADRQRAGAETIMTKLSMQRIGDTITITQEIADALHMAAVALRQKENK